MEYGRKTIRRCSYAFRAYCPQSYGRVSMSGQPTKKKQNRRRNKQQPDEKNHSENNKTNAAANTLDLTTML